MSDPFEHLHKLHRCWLSSAESGHGAAVTECTEDADGTLWVGNDEYGSQVNYCPVCGRKATVQIDAKLWGRDT